MKNETRAIIEGIESLLHGHPWFGRNATEFLADFSPKDVYTRPGNSGHSACDLLWHMNSWAAFTANRIEGSRKKDVATDEKLDWRKTGPKSNNWEKGLAEFSAIHKKIIKLLREKDDEWLDNTVDFREYNFRYLLNGMIQHDIYHLGQIVLLGKLLKK
jgi:uncharacterized damage-inducible protein DinB